jgi:hypothetical protein
VPTVMHRAVLQQEEQLPTVLHQAMLHRMVQ